MPTVLRIATGLMLVVFTLQTGFAQMSENYYARLDKVWQVGTCNCYIFSISLWASVSDDKTAATSQLHQFKIINGAECKDLKDGDDQPQLNSAVSLNEVDQSKRFDLQPVDQSKMRQYKDLAGLYSHKENINKYPHIALKTTVFKDKNNNSGASAFAISLLSTEPGFAIENAMVADIHFFEENAAQ